MEGEESERGNVMARKQVKCGIRQARGRRGASWVHSAHLARDHIK